MFPIGSIIDKAAEVFNLPEPVGDLAKIGIGIASGNPMLIFDGVTDLTPNVCDFLEDELNLDEGNEDWKKAARFFLDNARNNAETGSKLTGMLNGGGGADSSDFLLKALAGQKV